MALNAKIDDVLYSYQLTCVNNYVYKVGDCLFDFISYIIQNSKTSNSLQINSMNYLKHFLLIQTPLAICCRRLELNSEFLHDLHNGIVSTIEAYLNKMLQNATHGGLWGNFIVIFWISQYLQRPIYVWCKTTAWILMTCKEEYNLTLVMHLIFGNQYFEPIQETTSFHLQNEFLETESIIGFKENLSIQQKKNHLL
jgi:hypothetical protein